MPPLRIGVNALYLIPGGVGGTEIYLRNLLRALAEIDAVNRYFIFTNRETGTDLVPDQPNFVAAPQPVRAAFRPARILWEQIALPASILSRRLDVIFNPGFTSPLWCSCPAVTVFHDLQHKRHPEHFRWFDLPFWRLFLYASARRADLLIAVSEATRRDLVSFYPWCEGRVRVVPHGVESGFFQIGRERLDRLEAYLLCVSTLHPHKNLDRLIRAFARFRSSRPEFSLVLTGLRGFYSTQLERLVAALDLGDSVRLTGWVPRDQLYDLYLHAFAFIYPSTFEGFGMPVLEALAAGIPTACSGIEPLREVAGSAALLFDPLDEAAVHDALVRLTSDESLRERLAAEGPCRAAGFSWRNAAESTLEAIRSVA